MEKKYQVLIVFYGNRKPLVKGFKTLKAAKKYYGKTLKKNTLGMYLRESLGNNSDPSHMYKAYAERYYKLSYWEI